MNLLARISILEKKVEAEYRKKNPLNYIIYYRRNDDGKEEFKILDRNRGWIWVDNDGVASREKGSSIGVQVFLPDELREKDLQMDDII